MASVVLSGVRKVFGSFVAVHGLDLEIGETEFVSLLGPSGCGKTTTLRMLAGLDFPTAGEISIGGRVVNHVPPGKRNIAMVFQSYALYPHMTVGRNIAYPLKKRRVPPAERARLVAETAELLQLTELLDRKPRQLSGGQQQRVALAGRWCATPTCSCSTSRCPTWTPSCGATCGRSWWSCTGGWAGRWSMSPTTSSRR